MINELNQYEIGFFNILNMGKKIWSDNMKTMAFILMIIFFPINLVLSIVNQFRIDSMANVNMDILFQNISTVGFDAIPKNYVMYNFLYMVVQFFFEPLGIMAVAYVTWKCVKKESVNYKEAVSISLEKGGMFIISAFIYIMLIFVGGILIFPAIYIAIAGSFYFYAIIIDNKNPLYAISQSIRTVRGRWFRTFAYLMIIDGFKYVVSLAVFYILDIFLGQHIFMLNTIGATISSFFNIIFYCSMSLIYINRKLLLEK